MLVHLWPPQVASGTVIDHDDTMMTCMDQRHGLWKSGDENKDTVFLSAGAVGANKLRGKMHVGPEVVAAETLDLKIALQR